MTSLRRLGQWRVVLAFGLMVGLPAAAYVAAPAQAVTFAPAPASTAPPAANLAGFNTSATSAGVQFQLLIPGLVPLGDPTLGNFIQASVPYSSSTSSTGPSNGTVAAPAWPGDAVATAGNALQTFEPSFPEPLVKLLDDPVVARSDYPPQVGAGASGSLQPTGPLGIGTAKTTSDAGSTQGSAAVTDLSPLGSSKAGAPVLDVATMTSSS